MMMDTKKSLAVLALALALSAGAATIGHARDLTVAATFDEADAQCGQKGEQDGDKENEDKACDTDEPMGNDNKDENKAETGEKQAGQQGAQQTGPAGSGQQGQEQMGQNTDNDKDEGKQ